VARDLLPEAHMGSLLHASIWALLGASSFLLGERVVAKRFGSGGAAGALGIVVGAVVDGVPESIIFGIQVASGQQISVAFLAAVFVSNIPQAIAPSADLASAGWNWRRVATLWGWVVLACGIASLAGCLVGEAADNVTGTRMAAFASGGILAMLSNSLIPFAHERSKYAGFWTVLGFCTSFAMT
jgi:ZIP family zinc transporter